MSCTYPMTIADNHGTPCLVPCGQCCACLLTAKGQTISRIALEVALTPPDAINLFSTHTFGESPRVDVFDTSKENQRAMLDLFSVGLRSLRDRQRTYENKHNLPAIPIRFYVNSEFGGQTLRGHLHAALLHVRPGLFDPGDISSGQHQNKRLHLPWWPHGATVLKELAIETVGYIANHGFKSLAHGLKTQRRFSTRPTLGAQGIRKLARDLFATHGSRLPSEIRLNYGKSVLSIPPTLHAHYLDELAQLGHAPQRLGLSGYENYRLYHHPTLEHLRQTSRQSQDEQKRLRSVHGQDTLTAKRRFYGPKPTQRF